MPVTVYAIEDSATLTDDQYQDGVITNRTADGAITLTLPDGAAPGTRYEFHCVAVSHDLVIQCEPSGNVYAGGQSGSTVTLKSRGAVLEITYTNPHVWTGIVLGEVEFA